MRLANFETTSGPHIGVVLGEEIADLTAVEQRRPDLQSLLCGGKPTEEAAALIPKAPRIPLTEARLLAPILNPGKFLAIGLNTRDHRGDVNLRWLLREPRTIRMAAGYLFAHPRPRHPYFFAKATSSVTGPGSPIRLPRHAQQVDWEGELAAVIGAGVHNAGIIEARAAIAGYLIANDVSVRDWQTDNPTGPILAKGYDTHGPLGPWMVTADEIDPAELELRTQLNGEQVQHGRIAELVHSPAEIVRILSQFCTLLPGDVIACGTFAGTGWPRGRFLHAGDIVRVTIDGIGYLENPVIDEPPQTPTGRPS